MKLKVSRTDTWAAAIDDRPGGLADKLDALAAAGANLELIIARRAPEQRGSGVVFVTPLKGAKQIKAAGAAGFQKTHSLHTVRIQGADKPGTGAKLTRALAEAGINLRGFSAAALGKQYITHLALDTAADASKAAAALKKLA
ncbi:MAG: ACT domain-containing protein [Limisphaerales bacterium]